MIYFPTYVFLSTSLSWLGVMNHLCWTLLGITELELFNTTESSSDTMAKILYAIFIIVALVLLVNMMIAVLSHTYERVEVILTP